MKLRIPTPLNGWRRFVGEVAIIVLGVLIALSAEQAVERWRLNQQLHAAREALRGDFKNILALAGERQAEDKCIRDRLLFLRDHLDRNGELLPALGHVGSPPARAWYPASWDSLVSSNVSAQMKRDDLLAYGSIAQQARIAEETARREIEAWTIIYTMVGPARTLASGEAAQLRKALTDAAFQLNTLRLVAPQVAQAVEETGLLTQKDRAEARFQVAQTMRGVNARHICGPVSAPDPMRVDAPYDPAVQSDPLHRSED